MDGEGADAMHDVKMKEATSTAALEEAAHLPSAAEVKAKAAKSLSQSVGANGSSSGSTPYRSWKKKHLKMRIGFEDKMELNKKLHKEEVMAIHTSKRLAVEIERLLDLLLDINDSPQIPVNKRIDIRYRPTPEDDDDYADVSDPILLDIDAARTASYARPDSDGLKPLVPTKTLRSLIRDVPHCGFAEMAKKNPELVRDLVLTSEPGSKYITTGLARHPESFLAPDDVDNYLWEVDRNIALHAIVDQQDVPPMLPTLAPFAHAHAHAPDAAHKAPGSHRLLYGSGDSSWEEFFNRSIAKQDLQSFYRATPAMALCDGILRNRTSVYNWLKDNAPRSIFFQEGEATTAAVAAAAAAAAADKDGGGSGGGGGGGDDYHHGYNGGGGASGGGGGLHTNGASVLSFVSGTGTGNGRGRKSMGGGGGGAGGASGDRGDKGASNGNLRGSLVGGGSGLGKTGTGRGGRRSAAGGGVAAAAAAAAAASAAASAATPASMSRQYQFDDDQATAAEADDKDFTLELATPKSMGAYKRKRASAAAGEEEAGHRPRGGAAPAPSTAAAAAAAAATPTLVSGARGYKRKRKSEGGVDATTGAPTPPTTTRKYVRKSGKAAAVAAAIAVAAAEAEAEAEAEADMDAEAEPGAEAKTNGRAVSVAAAGAATYTEAEPEDDDGAGTAETEEEMADVAESASALEADGSP